jgi:uncharacterized membrane protein YkoI
MKAQAPSCRQPSADRLSAARWGALRFCVRAFVTLLASACATVAIAGEPQAGRTQQDHPPSKHQSQHRPQKQSQQLPSKHSELSAQQAVSIAKQRQQGKVLSVKRSNGSYKVKMLHQGQVRYITVAAD